MTFALPQLSKENLIKATIFAAAAGLALGLNLHPGPQASAAGSSRYSGAALQLASSNPNSTSSPATDSSIPGVPNQDFSAPASSTSPSASNPVQSTSNLVSSGQINNTVNVQTSDQSGNTTGLDNSSSNNTPSLNCGSLPTASGTSLCNYPHPIGGCPRDPRMGIACRIESQ